MNHTLETETGRTPAREDTDLARRRFLIRSTSVVGAAGMAAAAWPFLASWNPSERARNLGAPVEVDISKIEPGAQVTVQWQGKPIWVLRRTPAMREHLADTALLERLRDPNSEVASQQPEYAQNPLRAIREDVLVVIALCTHLGCIPTFRPDIAPADLGPEWLGGYFCPCHGSRFDFAGRVFKNVPAPTNLVIPPYHYVTDTVVQVGTDPRDPKQPALTDEDQSR